MNLKMDVIESEEGPALGGAMLAAKYEERYQKFRRIYPTVKELF